MARIPVEPIIENTTMERYVNNNGIPLTYVIAPIEGYVLHDNRKDWYEEYDELGNPIGEPILGYASGSVSVALNYDFILNPYNLYTVLASEVPADQIFGGGDNQHEVM